MRIVLSKACVFFLPALAPKGVEYRSLLMEWEADIAPCKGDICASTFYSNNMLYV
ncbi:hypothetical protein [Cellvibrio mixtus]|uniref:hypothetical protein n=1 Tax=Cellvibrio mixtus TaxID=39650 RepID=UPI001363BABB|nr:hypothetical protein [Cellvibrio mixtus]